MSVFHMVLGSKVFNVTCLGLCFHQQTFFFLSSSEDSSPAKKSKSEGTKVTYQIRPVFGENSRVVFNISQI